jgi:predicted DNA-binding transcriptional regulator
MSEITPEEREILREVAVANWLITDRVPFDLGKQLVERGFLKRQMNPNGRRQSGYILTAKGEEELDV